MNDMSKPSKGAIWVEIFAASAVMKKKKYVAYAL